MREFGAITGHIDFAQLALYLFWLFFLGLVLYLLRENNRDGFPLVAESGDRDPLPGLLVPGPKTFLLHDGTTVVTPRPVKDEPPLAAVPASPMPGSPLIPTGDPLRDMIGGASYASRADHPDLTYDDQSPKIVPLRVATDFFLAPEDPNPIGLPMLGGDRVEAGKVVDMWVDKSEVILRFYEVEVEGGKRVLIPSTMVTVNLARTECRASSLMGHQIPLIPTTKHPDQVTLLEEDQISAFVGGGSLYATPERSASFI